MLAATGILTNSDAKAIGEGLLTVLSEIEGGRSRSAWNSRTST
jgi:argininosuccinate lyase